MVSYTTGEPIYALSTPFSPSAIAVIRASGDSSLSLIKPFFKGKLENKETNTAIHGYIVDEDGSKIDEVVLIKYSSGHGYTSEEAFEIMCHGSLAVIKKISFILEKAGFRQALKGEFTYRAFVHGRMDLTEAEAVEELVSAKGDKSRVEALDRLDGSIKREAEKVRDDVLNILASLEVQLDYGEDELPEDWVFPLQRVEKIIERLNSIISTYNSSRLYRDGAKVVLAGRTNAGKSSLFNALLKENRAIVSPIAGTTRDYLECQCMMNDMPIRLFDTAGLRDADNEVEKEGINRTNSLMNEADLIIYVLDIGEEETEKDEKTLFVYSKSDIIKREGRVSFSSLTGEGVGDVVNLITSFLEKDDKRREGVPVIESERQKVKLEETIGSLKDAIENRDMSVDIIALYFQSALSSLGELTGEITTDDILSELFSSFCLGK